jgi:hypothetical protein
LASTSSRSSSLRSVAGRIVARELDEQDCVGLAHQRTLDHRTERRIATRKVDHRPIDELDRGGPECYELARRGHRRMQRAEVDDAERAVTGQRRERQCKRPRPCERAFAADEQVREVDAAVHRVRALALRVEHVRVVAAHTPHDTRHDARDLVVLALANRPQRRNELAHSGRRVVHVTLWSEPRFGPIREPDIQCSDVVHHVAVVQRARAARVVAGHPAERGLRRRADVDREPQAVLAQPAVQFVEDDARLDGDRLRGCIERHHAVQVLAVVDDEPGTDGLPALRAAGATRNDRHPECRADLGRSAHVVVARRDEDRERLHLVDRGIGRVARARRGVGHDGAGDDFRQPGGHILAWPVGVEDERLGRGRVHGVKVCTLAGAGRAHR